ncbi:MAG TPA: threonylcarbamoyl-AMP synthase [Candidatus Coproplasma excrementipullorum]|nr:threonylcarbamoyl-AMP synthase [Candidatus Coproplasma excrementipullorum]
MKTQILPIDEHSLGLAKDIIIKGGLVGFPTETVYGLGANALNDGAVKLIYATKGRPSDNPLIVHVHRDYDLSQLVTDIPDYAVLLAKAFLPGPLTMVYRSRGAVCPTVSCGLDTLAIRVPSHEGAQRFLKYVNLPIAAPSANISKHVSPVTAQHVFDDLDGKIELILDGGKCSGGIESTVLDCTGPVPCVLRSGLVTRDMVAQVAGECDEYHMVEGERVRSPGMKYKHYSPRCRTALFAFDDRFKALEEYKWLTARGERAYIMCDDEVARDMGDAKILSLGGDENAVAANLYDRLREGERIADIIIAVAPKKQDGVMVGVMNRLTKACG